MTVSCFCKSWFQKSRKFHYHLAGGSFSRVHATIYLISQQRENFKGKRKTKKWLFAFLLLLLSCVCKALSMEWVLEEEFHFFKNFVFTKGFFSATSKVLNEKWREEKHFFILLPFFFFLLSVIFFLSLLYIFFLLATISFRWQKAFFRCHLRKKQNVFFGQKKEKNSLIFPCKKYQDNALKVFFCIKGQTVLEAKNCSYDENVL